MRNEYFLFFLFPIKFLFPITITIIPIGRGWVSPYWTFFFLGFRKKNGGPWVKRILNSSNKIIKNIKQKNINTKEY
jgi:hypothetical protein